jgi:SRSO17 transposase
LDPRFQTRLQEMLDQAEVPIGFVHDLLPRLDVFLAPFVTSLGEPEQRRHAAEYMTGLLSNLERKTGEGIAYLLDQDRQPLQFFIGQSSWEHQPLLSTLATQVGQQLGEADGVLVFDPSGFPKKGDQSVGVERQWCGRLGKIENCQVGVYMAYVSRKEHVLVNVRLYLPKSWTYDRRRCRAAGVPKTVAFRTRHELALEMLAESGGRLPHAWIAGDDEMGRPSGFRRELRALGERYLLAVPSNTRVRDQEADPPQYAGKGRHPKPPFLRVDRWCRALPESAWTRIEVRDGEKGPLAIDAVKRRVRARNETGGEGPDEVLFITRERQGDQTFKLDYYFANADADVPLAEFARVAKAAHRIEECLERAKGEAGLADYQVRNWDAWHRHQTLSLLATWFLTEETRRGKNPDPCADRAAVAQSGRGPHRSPARQQPSRQAPPSRKPLAAPQRASALLLLSFT